jgi:4-amino-4-deoxy-L-arabinose transferase-like glycosyltransferase
LEEQAFAAARRNETLEFVNASPVNSAVTILSPREDSIQAGLRSPAAAVAVALVLRLGCLYLAHQAGGNFFSVGQEAGNVAWSLALGHGFSSPLVGMQGPTAWVAPVYPFLLALGFKLLSMNPYHVVVFGQVLNAIFSALTCWPIYLLAKKLFSLRVAVASGWTWAVLPTAILFPLEWIWDQSLAALLLTALLCATIYLSAEPSAQAAPKIGDAWRNTLLWAAYGIGWAFTLLTNPAIGLLLPVLLLWLAWKRHKTGAPWKSPVAIVLLTCVLGVVPWTVRNYAAFGRFVPVKSNFGLELWLGNNPDVKIIWTWWRSPASDAAESNELHRLGEIAYMREKQSEALKFILAHPGAFLDSSFDRFVDTWTALWDQRADPWVNALHAGTAYVCFCSAFSLLALLGLLLARRADALETFPLSAAMLFFPVTYYITHSAVRYRHPIDPVMTILAVYAAAYAYEKVAGKTRIQIEGRSPILAAESRQQKRARSRRTATTD